MSCRIKLNKDNMREGFTLAGKPSSLFKSLSAKTSNEDGANAYAYSFELEGIDRMDDGDAKLYTVSGLPAYKSGDKYIAAFPKGVYTESMTKLFNDIPGSSLSEFDKEVDIDQEGFDVLKQMFDATPLKDNVTIISRPTEEYHFYAIEDKGTEKFHEVYKAVKTFMLATGINIQDMNSYLSNIGYRLDNANGVQALADLQNKIIAYKDGASGDVLSEEIGHFIVHMFKDKAYLDKVYDKIVNSPLYKANHAKYMAKYNSEAKVREEILGQYVGKAIIEEIKTGKVVAPTGLKMYIKRFITFFKNMLTPEYMDAARMLAKKVIATDITNLEDNFQGDVMFSLEETSLLDKMIEDLKILNKSIDKKLSSKLYQKVERLKIDLMTKRKYGHIQEAYMSFLQYLDKDTKSAVKALDKTMSKGGSIPAKRLEAFENMLAYYEPMVDKLDNSPEFEKDEKVYELINKLSGRYKKIRKIYNDLATEHLVTQLETVQHKDDSFSIKDFFKQISNDTNSVAAWLQPMRDSSNSVVKIVHKILKQLHFRVHSKTVDFGKEFIEMLDGEHDLRFLYETKDGSRTGNIITQWNRAEYQEAFDKAREKIHKEFGLSMDEAEYREQKAMFSIPQLKAYNKAFSSFFKNNTQAHPRAQEIIDENRANMTPEMFKIWYKMNVLNEKKKLYTLRGELVVPANKYADPEFAKLTDKQKKIVDWYTKRKTKLDRLANVPIGKMPMISKDTQEIILTSNKSTYDALKYRVVDTFTRRVEDVETFGEKKMYRPDKSIVRFVPKMYTAPLENLDLLTDDVIASTVEYFRMAETYSQMSKEKAFFNILLTQIANTDAKGGRSGKETNVYKVIERMIEAQVYGLHQDELVADAFGRKINVTKVLNKVKKFTQANNLGLHGFTALTGYFSAKGFGMIEQMVGDQISMKSSAKARAKLLKLLPEATLEIGKANVQSELNVRLERLGLLPTTPFRMNNINKAGKIIVKNTLMGFYTLASYNIKAHTLYTFLEEYKLDKDGKFTRGEGDPIDFDKLTVDQLGELSFMVDTFANQLEGSLDESDKAIVQRHAWGSLLMTHKNWLVGGLSKRFKGDGYNYMLQRQDVGMYTALGDYMSMAIKEHGLAIIKYRDVYRSLPQYKKDAINKVAVEFASLVAAFTGMILLNAAIGDDEEEGINQHLLFLSNRVFLELSALSVPMIFTESVNTFGNPFVVSKQVDQILDLTDLFNGDVLQSGTYEGYTKREKAILKLIPGFKGLNTIYNPSSANQFLKAKALKRPTEIIDAIVD